jgi:UDPglucose 6-dehydrogenase
MVITVFGLGFVGLTTALGFSEYGHKVYGVEVDLKRLETIKSGKLPFLEPGLDKALTRHLNKSFFPVTTDQLSVAIAESECIYYCVGTPYGKDGRADLGYLFSAVDQTLKLINDGRFRVLVVKSTIPPSTTSQKIIPFIEGWGVENGRDNFIVGKEIGVANNPEFLREGYCWSDFMEPDRIVLGVSDLKSEKKLRELYSCVGVPVKCVSLNTGEFIKYLSNTLLATLISYSNEMSVIADTIGDIDVAQAFKILHMDKRWGGCNMASYVYPGCGYGGYCLPKDTNALYAVTKSSGFDAKILKNVIETNDSMPEFIAERIVRAVNAVFRGNESVICNGTDSSSDSCEEAKKLKIGLLGLSFKPGSDDVRDAPSAKIIKALIARGYSNLSGYDPVANEEFKTHYNLPVNYCDTLNEIIEESDLLVIATAWPEFKEVCAKQPKSVVDCRYML